MFTIHEYRQSKDGNIGCYSSFYDNLYKAMSCAMCFVMESSTKGDSWSVSVEFDGHVLFALNSDMGVL